MIEQEQSVLQLPKDFLKAPTTSYQPEHWVFEVPVYLAGLLQDQETELEGRARLLAAFAALLYRYTQQSTIRLELTLPQARLAGNYLTAIEVSVGEQTTAGTVVSRVADTLSKVETEIQSLSAQNPSVEWSSEPLLPVAISFIQSSTPEASALTLLQQAEETASPRELHLVIFQQGSHSSALLIYDASLFRLDTIQRLVGHWQILVAGMQNGSCPIAQLPLLTPAEIQQLASWSSDTVPYPEIPMHRRIEVLAAQQPDAIALTFRDQQLTYAQLNQRANQLAHYLNRSGVGPGVVVAVCVEPCLEILISLLGVFKAGGIYVPLDPTYPLERQEVIFADTQPQVLLTQSHLLSHLPAGSAQVLCFDRAGFDSQNSVFQAQPVHNPVHPLDLDQTAYVVYTSGTTGKPKGVMVSQHNLINYILAAQERFGFNAQDVMPAIARFTFSITMFELLSPLVAGGRLIILEREHILDFQRLAQTLQQVTVVHTSPSLMKKLLFYIQEQGLEGQFQHLRHASCGGDMVPADLLETMKAVFQNAEIFVVYGCSEISCMGCAYPVSRDRPVTGSRVGTPFSNVTVRLLDPHQNPVPIGVPGEIWFGGAGVTLGYLHRADLTQKKFVMIEGQRFYRTGDLGRFDTEGKLSILGRNDFQIQLRGMRIEPGEIETTLRQSGVREAVVMAQEMSSGGQSLVAYVVLADGQTIAALRQSLQAKLPDYMVPAIFVRLDAMPLTPNGKLDRRSLPVPDSAHVGASTTDFVTPRTPLETQVAEIWAAILGLESISVYDDFFALGGHSLLATQVIYRLREALSLQIPISQMFESPTVADLASYLASLIQAQSSQPDSRLAAIVPLQRQSDLPLSGAQTGLWFLSQLEEGRALNIPLGINLVGTLDIQALEQSLTEITRRHETLRTIFPVVHSSPVQRVLPPSPLALSIVNLDSLPAVGQAAEVSRLARAAAQHPFDLALDRPLHIVLVRLNSTAHVLLITIHHIAADGWSLAVFRRELAALYSAFSQGLASPLAELPTQYGDFVQWQQQWLKGKWLNAQLAYWQQHLAGAPPLLEIPTDRPRPSAQTFDGGTAFFKLDAVLTQQLRTLSQQAGATLFMTLLAALGTLLSRYGGQQDLVIGSPIANRPRSEVEPLIGFFINVLALRLDLTGDPDFLSLLQRVRRVALDAYANQDIPFGQVVETVQPDRNRGYSPLFQVMFILQNSPAETFQMPGLTLSPLHTASGTAQYDLRLMMEETAEGLDGELEYNRELFDAATIDRMVGHFQNLLLAIGVDPTQPITRLPLLSAVERQQMLQLGRSPDRAYPRQCIHQLFEAQVQQTPDAIALVAESEQFTEKLTEKSTEQLTYRALNQRANQLARYLQTLGVGPEVLVAIVMERSIDLLVSILAVLKAGGAYVPIDPTYSSDRQSYQLADSQAAVILTQPHLVATLPGQLSQVLVVDTAWEQIAHQGGYSAEDLPAQAKPENLAYIIYTSGSTGNPKGVMVLHQGIVNHATVSVEAFELTAVDRVLQFSSVGFDIFVEEVFPALISGATLVLRSDEMALSIRAFCQFIQRHDITVLDIPTAFWHELVSGLALLQKTIPASVRLVVVGGEKALRSSYQQWLQLTQPQVRWLNTYGPTEATVTTTLFDPVRSGFDPAAGEIPIGRSIANLQTYILDPLLQPVPIGVPGELHIGGAGLARGYLNQPERSQAKFIPHPFETEPEARLYKTGDIAYYLPDGNIGFVGRSDYQVKIRGFRIELGEIETCLEQHPDVQQAVVLVKYDESGNKSLAAYIVTPNPQKLTTDDLHQFLQSKLPPYMLPTLWMVLKNFPLTANGKVDRQALPTPTPALRKATSLFAAPQSALERQLSRIWKTVLGVESIGVDDNFFDLGGHSLLAVRLWAETEQVIDRELPLATLFQAPTIRQLAAQLQRSEPVLVCPSLVVMQRGSPDRGLTPLFCIHILGRGLKFYRPMLQYMDAHQTIYGLSTNMTGEPLPSDRMEDLAAHYLAQMRMVQPQGPYLLAGISFGGMVAFEIAQQLLIQGEQVGFLGLLDTYTPKAGKPIALSRQVKEHGRSLVNQGLSYLLKKVRDRWIGQMRLWADVALATYRRSMIRLLQATEQPLPENLQDFAYQEQSYRLAKSYRLLPYPGQSTLFKAAQEQIGGVSLKMDSAMGWREFIQGELTIHVVPGTHLEMLQDPHVRVLAKELQADLSQFHRSRTASNQEQ